MAATGHPRRFATLVAIIAVIASIAAGCGDDDSQTAKIPTLNDSQTAKTPLLQDGPETSPSEFVGKLEKAAPEQITQICLMTESKGEDAAFAYFKKGYSVAFSNVPLSPNDVFDEILEHCG